VAGQALAFQRFGRFARPVLVNGAPGLITVPNGEPVSVMGFTIVHWKIIEINLLADPDRLSRLDLRILGGN
jgi:RNA polymerase sigma-70 factor, ECF subfamily